MKKKNKDKQSTPQMAIGAFLQCKVTNRIYQVIAYGIKPSAIRDIKEDIQGQVVALSIKTAVPIKHITTSSDD